VALATAVPLALISGVSTLWFACRSLDLQLGRYLLEGMLRPGAVCLVFVVPALIVQQVWRPVGWLPLGIAAGTCWAGFAACAWTVALDAGERARWRRMVPGLVGRGAAAPAGTGS
jgi:hypothetical protein